MLCGPACLGLKTSEEAKGCQACLYNVRFNMKETARTAAQGALRLKGESWTWLIVYGQITGGGYVYEQHVLRYPFLFWDYLLAAKTILWVIMYTSESLMHPPNRTLFFWLLVEGAWSNSVTSAESNLCQNPSCCAFLVSLPCHFAK